MFIKTCLGVFPTRDYNLVCCIMLIHQKKCERGKDEPGLTPVFKLKSKLDLIWIYHLNFVSYSLKA